MFISKNLVGTICAMALPLAMAVAQDAPAPAARPSGGPGGPGGFGRMRPPMMGQMTAGSPIFARMLARPEFIKELGLPEETITKLTEGLKKLDEQEKALREEREKLLKVQADLMASLMSDRTKTGDEVRKAAADIEAVQNKLFGINIDRMLIVRDNLTDEQIKQATEQVKKNFEKRRDEMMKRRGEMMSRREGRRGPEGKGPHPGPKAAPEAGAGDPPPPPAEAAPAAAPEEAR